MPNDILRVSDAQVAADRSILAAIVSGFVDGRRATVERVGDDVTVTSHDAIPVVWFGAAHDWRNAVRYAEEPETPSQRERREVRDARKEARNAVFWALCESAKRYGYVQTDPTRPPTPRLRLEQHEIADASDDRTDRFMLDVSRSGKRIRVFVPTQSAGEDALVRFAGDEDFAVLALAYNGYIF